jgi:pyrroline-5-carboxylate reductase
VDGTLAIIGAGRLGEALLRGLLASAWVDASQVVVTARSPERVDLLARTHGVKATTDNAEAIGAADVVLLAVKPQKMHEVLDPVRTVFHAGQTVISLAAGTTTAFIEGYLPADVPVVRVMTNTPVQVDEAMSVVCAGAHASDADLAVAEEILSHVGRVVRMGEEHLNSVTALSGSGPAYFFLLAEAMIDAGILLGLPRDVSTELIVQTMVGSAKMLRDAGKHPVELREMVTSPGGTTIAAIRELEGARVRAAFLDAIEAAKLRGDELSGG